jgi:cytochrome c biogenesis protein
LTRTFIKFASSLRVTVLLLLLLAALGAVGTFGLWPRGLSAEEYRSLYGFSGSVIVALGLDDFHKSLLYRGLFVLFCLNLSLCGFRRSLDGFRDFAGMGKPQETLELGGGSAGEALAAAGFSVSEDGLGGWRRRWGFLGFPLVHLAPLAVALGAFWGSVGGFIATENIYVGNTAATVYSWDLKKDVNLPFVIAVRGRNTSLFPGQLRITSLRADGTQSEPFEARPGEAVPVPGTGYSARVEEFDPETSNLRYFIIENAFSRGPFSRGREEGAPVRLRPYAFKGFEIKRVEVPVELQSSVTGGVLASGVIAVNDPLSYQGYKIFLTAWGEDDAGAKTVGLQITRDPGEGVLWAGSVLLALGIFILLFSDAGWARVEEGRLLVKASPARRKLIRSALSGRGQEENDDDT